MSIMSQLHAELSEQANELGYETLEGACQDGYHVEFDTNPLTHEESATLVSDLAKEQERAHLAYIVERAEHEKKLKVISEFLRKNNAEGYAEDIDNAIEFFNQGER